MSKGCSRQRVEPRALDHQALSGTLAGCGVDALIGGLLAPDEQPAHVGRRARKGPTVEKRLANVLDARLDATLVLGVADWGGNGLEEVVAGEVQETAD